MPQQRARPKAARPSSKKLGGAGEVQELQRELALLRHELAVYREEARVQTEQLRQSSRELEQSRDRYADLFDFAPIGYATLDKLGCIQAVNLTAAALFGLDRAQLLRTPLMMHFAPPDRRRLLDHVRQARRSPQTVTIELSALSAGSPIPVQLSTRRVTDVDRVEALWTVIMDLRERKQAESQLQIVNRELAERSQVLEQQTEMLRRLRRQLVQAQDAERRRIAALLHEDVQQALFAIRLRVSLLDAGEPGRELEAIIDRTIATCRGLSAELRPPILHGLGLIPSLEWLAKQMLDAHGLQVRVVVRDPPDELSRELTLTVYSAVQELLFNVVKHAETPQAVVEVSRASGLVVEVRDQGRGFVSQSNRAHLGLYSIAESVQAVGGALDVVSTPGSGTRARLTFSEELLLPAPPATRSSRPPAPARTKGAARPRRRNGR